MSTADDIRRWEEEGDRRGTRLALRGRKMEWEDVIKEAFSELPEQAPPLPFNMTPEGQRFLEFSRICPIEFTEAIENTRLPNSSAFSRVVQWDGVFPGPMASGATGTAKTRAAWAALKRLHIDKAKTFAWFPVKRLLNEFNKYEAANLGQEFYKQYSYQSVLFVDDIDKINWSFDSESAALFQFYDWVYRENRPCISTTNRPAAWWSEKMGEAFTRRLFTDAHFHVDFTGVRK